MRLEQFVRGTLFLLLITSGTIIRTKSFLLSAPRRFSRSSSYKNSSSSSSSSSRRGTCKNRTSVQPHHGRKDTSTKRYRHSIDGFGNKHRKENLLFAVVVNNGNDEDDDDRHHGSVDLDSINNVNDQQRANDETEGISKVNDNGNSAYASDRSQKYMKPLEDLEKDITYVIKEITSGEDSSIYPREFSYVRPIITQNNFLFTYYNRMR